MKEFWKKVWKKIKLYWNLFVVYVKINWKHWLTLGLTKIIEILNDKKYAKEEKILTLTQKDTENGKKSTKKSVV